MTASPSGDRTTPEADNTRGSSKPSSGFDRALEDIEAVVHDLENQVREVNQKIDEKAGRPLWQAIVVGLALGLTFFGLLIFSSLAFALFVSLLIAVSVVELVGALRSVGARLSRVGLVMLALLPPAGAFFFGPVGLLWALFISIVLVAVGRLALSVVSRGARVNTVDDIAKGIFVLTYLPFLASFAVLLATLPGGQWWVLAAVITVIVIDTGAYATGLSFGRHKLAPQISPGKTWEGFAGSTVLAIIAGAMLGHFMMGTGWLTGSIIALALVASATVGDLVESLIKRDIGVKDISSWLPGHGGFLDRLDSVVPSMAVIYVAYQIVT
jgi:phosphatidate cytidylyltransferase